MRRIVRRSERRRHDGADAQKQSCVFRLAEAGDVVSLQRLAARAPGLSPSGRVLVAEVNGQLWAAVDLEGWRAVSDPRHPAGDIAFALAMRARQLVHAERAELRQRTRRWRQGAKAELSSDLC
jgi:hypothetical protein